jgi:hypothetical protein
MHASPDAINFSCANSGSCGTAARRPTVDDGSSSYLRIGYRIAYFRLGAASLLDRGSTYSCCPQNNLVASPHRACGRGIERTSSDHCCSLGRLHLATDIPNKPDQFVWRSPRRLCSGATIWHAAGGSDGKAAAALSRRDR